MDQQTPEELLATLTDRVLEGQDMKLPAEMQMQDEAYIVHMLFKAVAPQKDLDARFRMRLSQTLSQEWERSRHQKRRQFALPRYVQAAAAVFLVVIVVGMLAQFEVISVTGTVASSSETDDRVDIFFTVVAILGGAAVALGLLFYFLRKPR